MSGIRVTVRGADVPPGAGVTDENGYPLVSDPADLAANAWTLWQAARNRVTAESAPPKSQGGIMGFALFCKLDQIEHFIWPVMTTMEGDPTYAWSKYVRDELRQYLHNSGNMKLIEGTAGGRAGATWWVRAHWDGQIPPMPAPPAKFVAPMASQPKNKVPKVPDEIKLTPAEVTQVKEASAPELEGVSLPADILACLNGDDRMHAADLIVLLSAGNPAAYAGLNVTSLGKRLKDYGVEYDRVTIDYKTLAGVRHEDVRLAHDRTADAEAAVIVQEAHARAEATESASVVDRAEKVVRSLHALDKDFSAMLGEYQNMKAQVENVTAENEKLRKQGGKLDPAAFDEAVNAAAEKIAAPLRTEIESLTHQLRAARRLR